MQCFRHIDELHDGRVLIINGRTEIPCWFIEHQVDGGRITQDQIIESYLSEVANVALTVSLYLAINADPARGEYTAHVIFAMVCMVVEKAGQFHQCENAYDRR
jgi:hypothetical protein